VNSSSQGSSGSGSQSPPKLLDRVRRELRLRHYSARTEESYVHWVRRFVLFHGKRHPAGLGGPEIAAFLSHLACEGQVAASTQNQALGALVFLYRHVLGMALPDLQGLVRARPGWSRVFSTGPGCACSRRSRCG
jgi:hypothetical protein